MAQEAYDPESGAMSRRRMLRRGGRRGAGAAPRRRADPAERSRRPAQHRHPAAARLQPARGADHLLHRSRRPHRGAGLQRAAAAQRADPAAVDRRALVGGTGLERAGPVPGVERHPEQPPAPVDRGQRARQRLPRAVEQQQRQHLRLPGAAALLRARHPARGALRARRLGEPHRGDVQRQAAQLAERRGAVPGRQLLVHRSALRGPALRGHGGRGGRAREHGRPAQPQARPAARARLLQARAAHRGVSRRQGRRAHPGRGRGPGAGSQRALLLARLQEGVRDQHRQGPRRGARARCTSSTWGRTTS